MAIRCRCPHCQQLMSIASRMAGREVECPGCSRSFVIPESGETADRPSGSSAASPQPAETPSPATSDKTRSRKPPAGPDDTEDDAPPLTIRKAETDFEEMDLTPMVDVTFLLLIFFMITASFSLQKTIEVPPPDPEQQGATQSIQQLDDLLDASIEVRIDAENAITIDDEPITDRASLADALQDRMRSDQKTELVLIAEARALHETVVLVIDAANEAGMQKIRLATSGSLD